MSRSGTYYMAKYTEILMTGCVGLFATEFLLEYFILDQMLSSFRKIRNTTIRSKTKVKDILEKVKESKWAGHVARFQDNRWTKRLTEWRPRSGRRKRGRHKRRWRDDLTNYIGTTWTRQAQDRRRWQLLEEGYIQQWMQEPRWGEVRWVLLLCFVVGGAAGSLLWCYSVAATVAWLYIQPPSPSHIHTACHRHFVYKTAQH